MIFRYTELPSSVPGYSRLWRPYIRIRLFGKGTSFPVMALVDSGADGVLIDKDIAIYKLGLDWKTGEKSQCGGAMGATQEMYLHDLEMEVIDIKNSRKKIRVGFLDGANAPVLLGQHGFFEHYHIRFKQYGKIFDIEPKP